MRYMIAADTGGTFTDVAVYDADTQRVVYGKTLTNYTDLVDGVLAYRHPTDRLRPGIAGISESNLRIPDVAFFATSNPGWTEGYDLVCLCELAPENLRPSMRPMLLGLAEPV